MKGQHDQGNSNKALIKENTSLGLASSYGDSIHSPGGKHGGVQVDMVLEKEPRVLHLDRQAAGSDSTLDRA